MRLGLRAVPVIPGISRSPVGVGDVVGSVVVFLLAFWSQRWVLDLPLTAIDTIPTLAAARVDGWTEIFDVLLRELRGGATGGAYYRPLTLITYTFDQWIWGGTAFGYHLTDVVLHGLATVAVFWMVRVAVDMPRLAALFASALFLMHPAVIEVVPAIARRQEPLLVIGLCLAVIGARFLPQRVGWLTMLLGSLIAVTAVERGLVVPGVVAGYLFFLRYAALPASARVAVSIRSTLPVLGVAVGFFAFHAWLHGSNGVILRLGDILPLSVSFAMLLVYPQQIFDVVTTASLQVRLLYLVAAVVIALAFGLPLVRANRRGVIWFAGTWIGSYVLLLGLVGVFNAWYVYTAVPGLCLVIVFFCMEVYREHLNRSALRLRASLAALAGLLLIFAVVVATPVVRSYRGWRVASQLSERFLDELEKLSRELPADASVVILNLPAHFRESDSDYLVTRSAAILWPSSVEVWRSEKGIDLDLTLLGSSNFVNHLSVPRVEIGDDDIRVYFTEGSSRYTNANGAWPLAKQLPESIGRGYSFPWSRGRASAASSAKFLLFDGERLVPVPG